MDTQIKTNTDAIATNATSNTSIQTELDATQTGAGLGTDGAYTANGSTNYLTTVTSLTSADVHWIRKSKQILMYCNQCSKQHQYSNRTKMLPKLG
ncbi:hypothetical protein [Polaribacter filamentus]|uniref:hypothetical protein n=1 Tax=Polaribacter filamentus TaxID=53483 RepID=UPI0011B076A1|nr:hypothetical protein [Polaribacter filamentus]